MRALPYKIYRIIRAIVFTVIILAVAIPSLIYILLSIKPVQNIVRNVAQTELSKLLGAEIEIDDVDITPFNRVDISGVNAILGGDTIASVNRLSAGVDILDLIFKQKITITYAALVGGDVYVSRDSASAPLNIQPIIDHLSKDKKEKNNRINLRVNTVILRNVNLNYDVLDYPLTPDIFNPNHVAIRRLRADANIPEISDSIVAVNLKRLDFTEQCGLRLNDFSARLKITPQLIEWSDVDLSLPQSRIDIADGGISLPIQSGRLAVQEGSRIYIPELAPFFTEARQFPYTLNLMADVEASPSRLSVEKLSAVTAGGDFNIQLHGTFARDSMTGFVYDVPDLSVAVSRPLASRLSALAKGNLIPPADYSLLLSAKGNGLAGKVQLEGHSDADVLNVKADYQRKTLSAPATLSAKGDLSAVDFRRYVNNADFGPLQLSFEASAQLLKKILAADASVEIVKFGYKNNIFKDIETEASWKNGDFSLVSAINDSILDITVDAGGRFGLKNVTDSINIYADVRRFNPHALALINKYPGMIFSGEIEANLSDLKPSAVAGYIMLNELTIRDAAGDIFSPGPIALSASGPASDRHITLSGDIIHGKIEGIVDPVALPGLFGEIARQSFPALTATSADTIGGRLLQLPLNKFDFSLSIEPTESLRNIFNPPVTSLYPATISGKVDSSTASVSIDVDAPYLRQGEKIIEDTHLHLAANGISSAKRLNFTTRYPSKDGLTTYNINADGIANLLNLSLDFAIDRKARYDGEVKLTTLIGRSPLDNRPTAKINILPSEVTFNDSTWTINPALITWADGAATFDHFNVSRENQFVKIHGVASASESDTLNIDIRNFDLGYLFDALSIDNVPLGGYTTGSVTANSVLTPSPHASATDLFVKDISFSDCVIGDAIVSSRFVPENLAIFIDGDVTQANGLHSQISVDLRPASHELDVNITANETPVGFLDRYFYAFADDVKGTASGWLRVFGTFEDVDLEGRLNAEDVDLRLIFSNVRYQASDSIIITPGRISLPALSIKDEAGRKAILKGFVTHHNFDDFKIDLSLSEVKDMLLFNVKPSDEIPYFGKIYGSGHATIKGDMELLDIKIIANTSPGSIFTFSLDDREIASEYTFLTFRDKNAKDAVEVEEIDEHLLHINHLRSLFNRKKDEASGNFNIEILVNVTPESEVDLIMDPVAGDKIRAFGNGDLRLTYSSASDEMEMFGTYTVDRGFYNFTLQEIIIKDFIIEQGSEVAFSGDPLNARLNIKAYYSLNANLTDLDETFANDKDLNRTNVPVHAVLKVEGDINEPQLSFDIEFPTLTSDVYRKVRSIVSTEEMMNRQIIYLLALNRFYTPDYMSTTKGNELFSVASSTISSQLSNILGQLSDKWMIAPNLRSDRGDFSDVEVDVALSSRLLNNRLLLNGNFGYRDKSLNTNQFIGDFDIEYLLNRQGSIRLKAYNHYNDQNYYVRTANTTQGVGIMFKHDFDNFFGFLRRLRHKTAPSDNSDHTEPEVK